ncbi:MAG: hypothetical protein V1663_00545 [archaeon]
MEIGVIGLLFIIFGWAIQLGYSLRGKKDIQTFFVVSYIIGVAFLVYDGYTTGLKDLAFYNLVSLIVSGIVLFMILKKK